MQSILFISTLYLFLFILIYSYFDNNKKINKVDKSNNSNTKIMILLLIGFILRIMLANVIEGHRTDIACFKQWSERLATVGLINFYSPDYFADYPPLYMLLLYVFGKIRLLFDMQYNSQVFTLLIKLPAIIADVVLCGMIYSEGKKYISKSATLTLCTLVILSPALIINSTFWGQIDSVFTAFLILSLLQLHNKKYYLSALMFVLCALIKPQAFIFAPVYICAFFETKNYKMIGKTLLYSIFTVLIISLPFTKDFNFMWIIEKYKNTFSSYPYATINAYNLYALFGYNWKSISDKFIFLPISFWSSIVILLTTIASFWFYFKSKDKSKIFYMGYLIITSIFTVGAKMHERYIFPALLLLVFSYIYKKDKRLLFLFIAQTITHFLNVSYVFINDTKVVPNFNAFIAIVSIINICILVYSIILAKKIYISENKEQEKLKVIYTKENINYSKMIRLDYIIMLAITVIYSIVAFVNIGDMKAPQTFYNTTTNDAIYIDVGSVKQISSVMFYYGIGNDENTYTINSSNDGVNWTDYQSIKHKSVFLWVRAKEQVNARFLKITCDKSNMMIGEIGVIGTNGKPMSYTSNVEQIFDEQSVVPLKPSYLNGSYFDEIYHPRTAYEITHELTPYEITHPPLGKVILSFGIKLFGMTPFGWRVMGTIAGILMLPIFYLICKKLFEKTYYASIGTFLFAIDFMHFAQTRLGTVDSYAVLFIMLMYYFVIDYMRIDFNNDRLKKGFIPLMLTGIFFGIGAATKWICLYSGLGLFVLVITVWIKAIVNSKNKHDTYIKLIKTVIFCILFFIIVPALIYFVSYLPQISYDLNGRTAFNYVVQNQSYMLSYHEGVTQSHPFSSTWYQWIIDYKPLWAYIDSELSTNGIVSSISTFGNPAIWWGGFISIIVCFYVGIKKKSNVAYLILIAYLSQLVPWMFITRTLFIYHYFACVPFLVLAIVYAIKWLRESLNVSHYVIFSYCTVALLLFIMFYPVISGFEVPKTYVQDVLKWFDSWTFF